MDKDKIKKALIGGMFLNDYTDTVGGKLFSKLIALNCTHSLAFSSSVTHGSIHSVRVFRYAYILKQMIECIHTMNCQAIFAAMHDAFKKNDEYDEWHGGHAAVALNKTYGGISTGAIQAYGGLSPAHSLELTRALTWGGIYNFIGVAAKACEMHTGVRPDEFDSLTEGFSVENKLEIMISLDADRLDYARYGTAIDAKWLFTDEAKQIAEVANELIFG